MRYGEPLLFGNELARVFGLSSSQSLLLRTDNSTLAVTHLVSSSGQPTPTKPSVAEQGFAIPVQLAVPDAANWGFWVDGRYTHTPKWQQGGIGIYDLESDPRIRWDTPFELLHFNVPRATLNAFTEDADLPRVSELRSPEGIRDPVLYHLAQMILPFIREKSVPPALFVDHYFRMLCGRLVISYGSGSPTGNSHRGGLAPWQMRRALELVESNLSGDLRLHRLAAECGLSASYFCRCFRITFGTSVHKFVISKRIERARRLLLQSKLPLAEIALEAGFSDQAVFSRTFGAIVGTPPARWRTEHLIRTRQYSKSVTLGTTRILDAHKPLAARDSLPIPMARANVA
jgi:AraC family transcriptional regulator